MPDRETTPEAAAGLVKLDDERGVMDVLARSVFGLWTVVNDLSRLRPVQRIAYRVTIFGSARIEPGHWIYQAVRDLGAELTRLGCDIVTGGGPGLMQAANEGARIADLVRVEDASRVDVLRSREGRGDPARGERDAGEMHRDQQRGEREHQEQRHGGRNHGRASVPFSRRPGALYPREL